MFKFYWNLHLLHVTLRDGLSIHFNYRVRWRIRTIYRRTSLKISQVNFAILHSHKTATHRKWTGQTAKFPCGHQNLRNSNYVKDVRRLNCRRHEVNIINYLRTVTRIILSSEWEHRIIRNCTVDVIYQANK